MVVKPDGVVNVCKLDRTNTILDWQCPECSMTYGAIKDRIYGRDDRHFHRVCHCCAVNYADLSYYEW